MPDKLLDLLFSTSQQEDAMEGDRLDLALDQMFEQLASMESIKPTKTGLAAALAKVGLKSGDYDGLDLDPNGLSLTVTCPGAYADIKTLLTDPSNLHELASAGWVASFPGDQAMTREHPEFKVRFTDLMLTSAGDSDKAESPASISNKSGKDGAKKLDRPAPDKAEGSGIGKAKDGAAPGKVKEAAEDMVSKLLGEGEEDEDSGRFEIAYEGFLGNNRRTFPSKMRAEQWLRQVGKPELIRHIKQID